MNSVSQFLFQFPLVNEVLSFVIDPYKAFLSLFSAATNQNKARPSEEQLFTRDYSVTQKKVFLTNGARTCYLPAASPSEELSKFSRYILYLVNCLPIMKYNIPITQWQVPYYIVKFGLITANDYWKEQLSGAMVNRTTTPNPPKTNLEVFIFNGPGLLLINDDGDIDLSFLEKYKVRDECLPYGCLITLDHQQQLVRSITIGGRELPYSEHPCLEKYERIAEATLLFYTTAIEHLLFTHLLCASNFTCSINQSVIKDPLLQKFLYAITYGTNNISVGAETILLGENDSNGWVIRMFGYDKPTLVTLLSNCLDRFQLEKRYVGVENTDCYLVNLLKEYYIYISEFVIQLSLVVDLDEVVRIWNNINYRLTCDAKQFVTALLFRIWVLHPLMGDLDLFAMDHTHFPTKVFKNNYAKSTNDMFTAGLLLDATSVDYLPGFGSNYFHGTALEQPWEQLRQQFINCKVAKDYSILLHNKLNISIAR